MAHFIMAGFTFQLTLRTTGLNELKLSRPPEILSSHEMREAVPFVGEMEGKPQKRSPCGVRTMLKLQMAACEDYAKKAKSR